MHSFKVEYSDRASLSAAGYGKVAHLPFIMDSRPGYHRDGSRYLIDRGLGIWSPNQEGTEPCQPPTPLSIDSYAHWLANFLEWADKRGVSLTTCTYEDDIYGRYQKELLSGIWSRDGIGLSAVTVNTYVKQACDFVCWMGFKGLRTAFHVPTTTRVSGRGEATSSQGHRSQIVEVRQGKVRQPKRRLKMPPDDAVHQWLESVYKKRGISLGLMCECVLQSAMRRREILGMRINSLPLDRADWHISNPTAEERDLLVLICIKYGAKGSSGGVDHGDKIGPERLINIPLHLAEAIHRYRQTVRPRLLKIWVKGVAGADAQRARRDESVHLFLDEQTGRRIQSWQFYNAWTAGNLPFDGWSPHLGRHWWACSTLWRDIKFHEDVLRSGGKHSSALIASVAKDIIRLKIQPQLGHSHDSTSFIYLQWVADMLGVALPEQYQRHMDDLAGE